MPSFTTIVATLAGCSAVVNGAAVPSNNGLTSVTLERRDNVLSKREPVLATILVAAGTAAVTAVVNEVRTASTIYASYEH